LATHPERAVVVVDFDGTLAPIVPDPSTARPLPATAAALARLAGGMGKVAVVSGRPVAFLRATLPVDGLVLVGQYGLERLEEGRTVTDPRVAAYAAAVAAAAEDAEETLPGLHVERKEGVAVTLHWRRAPGLGEEALALGRRLAGRHGLVLQPGRLALELRPPVPVDKGTAAAILAEGAHAALGAGDDHGDLAIFAALDGLVAKGHLAHALRVAVRSSEAPPELLEQADYQVDGPLGLAALFDRLADMLSGD
jgi:trehalose 6-phosphate phosphatase